MPLNLDHTERFFSRIYIRDRDTGMRTPFRLRMQQHRVLEQFKDHQNKNNRLFGIFLKARRVGLSTLAAGLLTAHCASKNIARSLVVAQTRETAKELFALASDFADDLEPIYGPGVIKKTAATISYPNMGQRTHSTYRQATAATVHGQRGMTLSALHMTEAAFYPYEGAFTSLMNTVSKDPDNIVLIESTANGMEGPGQAFYETWQAAEAGDNEFLPFFLPWYEDPAYVADPEVAADAPRDNYEKFLMNELKDRVTGKKVELGMERIAFFRQTLFTKCEGSLDKWRQEYPSNPEEAFIATGNPAFTVEETTFASDQVAQPMAKGRCLLLDDPRSTPTGQMRTEFQQDDQGPLWIWETPQAGHHYFFGVDSARGEANNYTPGDYAAIVGWNAETGEMCAAYQAKVSPEFLAETAAALGFWFNNAMLNVELNNLGYVVMRDLRDRIHYPSQYLWRGRDDKYPGKNGGSALGFETTDRTRRMMFNIFRTSLYRKEAYPRDRRFVSQMQNAKMEMGFRWDIAVGHDDLFMAGLLGWIAKEQNHPHVCSVRHAKQTLLTPDDIEQQGLKSNRNMPKWVTDAHVTSLGGIMQTGNAHLAKLRAYDKMKKEPSRLLGI